MLGSEGACSRRGAPWLCSGVTKMNASAASIFALQGFALITAGSG
jgi:hypothetical protein